MTKAKTSKRRPAKSRREIQHMLLVPVVARGERYAGILLDEKGKPSAHLVLLPGELDSTNWTDAKSWAAGRGGELPTRQEQSLLFANLKNQFQSAWYWSCEQCAGNAGYAWCQHFGSGRQDFNSKDNELRARAVRRVKI